MKVHAALALVAATLMIVSGCQKKDDEQSPPQDPAMSAVQASAIAGVAWSVPERWGQHPPLQMRVATYMVPPAEGDAEGGECAVFFFGSGQGGDVDGNIDRWSGQFENSPKPDRTSKTVNGLNVTVVRIAGTYLAPGGPMMESQARKENFRLLGAIVDAPGGFVFFKCTGPHKTITQAEAEFTQLVESLRKE